MKQIFLHGFQQKPLCIQAPECYTSLVHKIEETIGAQSFYLKTGSHLVSEQNYLELQREQSFISMWICLRLPGGKGGFGAMLKSQVASKKVENFDSCRDLSGKKIRHINNQIRMKQWNEKKAKEDQVVKQFMQPEKIKTKRNRDEIVQSINLDKQEEVIKKAFKGSLGTKKLKL